LHGGPQPIDVEAHLGSRLRGEAALDLFVDVLLLGSGIRSPELPKDLDTARVQRGELDAELTAVLALGAPGHPALHEDLAPLVLEAAHESVADLRQVARPHLHPEAADVAALRLEGGDRAVLSADLHQGGDRHTRNSGTAAVFRGRTSHSCFSLRSPSPTGQIIGLVRLLRDIEAHGWR